MFFAWLAYAIGAPELLGGFAAGLALSRRFFLPFGIALSNDPQFSRRIESQMQPIIQLFTPIFFVMVGLSLDLSAVNWGVSFIWFFFFSMLLIAIVSKLSGAFLLRLPLAERLAIGIAMVPRGEVGLIFAELGRTAAILNNDLYAGIIMVIAATTIFSPIVLKWHYNHHEKYFNKQIKTVTVSDVDK
ncbi:MAG: cation:proton antiporter, partial [Arenicellales bacterium]